MQNAIWSIAAAAFAGVALCGASPARGAASARADVPPVVAREASHAAPPALLAQTAVAVTPVVALQSAPAVVPPVAAQSGIIRAVAPNGSQPGVLWMIAIGALLCRLGARVVRTS